MLSLENEGKIVFLMGKSNAGKGTIFKLIKSSIDVAELTMVTDRPKRTPDENGYTFLSTEEFDNIYTLFKVIEQRSYNTVNGVWRYATVADGYSTSLTYLVEGTLESCKSLIEYFGEDIIIPIYLDCDDRTLLLRAIDRPEEYESKYKELCRRFIKDSEDFSKENINKIPNINIIKNSNDITTGMIYLKIIDILNKKA